MHGETHVKIAICVLFFILGMFLLFVYVLLFLCISFCFIYLCFRVVFVYCLDRYFIYLLTAIGFTPGGSVKVRYIQSSTHT
jgi:hypothetical protein